MPAPFNVPGSKNDRAICAYLYSAKIAGQYGISRKNCQPANSRQKMTWPYLTVVTTEGTPEPNASRIGNSWVNVTLAFYFSATNQPLNDNSEAQRVADDFWIASVIDSLQMSDNGGQDFKWTARAITAAANALATCPEAQIQQNNLDMGDYTMQDWFPGQGFQRGKPDDDACTWIEKFHFRALMCPSSVS